MPDFRTGHTALEKSLAVCWVYQGAFTVSECCDYLQISRRTWYNWEKQFKNAIQPIWGGLAHQK